VSKNDKDLDLYKEGPPDTWQRVHRAVDRSERSWPVTGPVVAVVSNWRAWGVMLAIFTFIRGPEIIDLIKAFMEAPK
jgi:hypothetical protein